MSTQVTIKETIHVSPDGIDSINCGQLNDKCKSVLFVLLYLQGNTSSLTIVLESDKHKKRYYNDIDYYSISATSGIKKHIRFVKDKKTNKNPIVFIHFTLGQRLKEAIDITVEFNSVDIIGKNQLFDISRRHYHLHNGNIKLRLFITNAIIEGGRKMYSFVHIFNISWVDIVIKNCRFVGTRSKRWFKLKHGKNVGVEYQVK